MMMMIPEPWKKDPLMSKEKRDFYRYHNFMIEPWDGPAAIGFCDSIVIGSMLDRNGLRPAGTTSPAMTRSLPVRKWGLSLFRRKRFSTKAVFSRGRCSSSIRSSSASSTTKKSNSRLPRNFLMGNGIRSTSSIWTISCPARISSAATKRSLMI